MAFSPDRRLDSFPERFKTIDRPLFRQETNHPLVSAVGNLGRYGLDHAIDIAITGSILATAIYDLTR